MKNCKRCLLHEAAEEDILAAIREKIATIPEMERAEESLYQTRLEACRTCDQLLSGMCLKCGCYVEFRAAFRRMKCPNVRERKW